MAQNDKMGKTFKKTLGRVGGKDGKRRKRDGENGGG